MITTRPDITSAKGSNSALIANLAGQFDASPSIYDPLRNRLREQVRSSISPFGSMLRWDGAADAPVFDSNYNRNDVGEAYRRQYQDSRASMNARGLLSSSFADQDMSSRIGMVTEQARQVRQQYLNDMEGLLREEYGYKTSISQRIQELLAQDAREIQETPVAAAETPALAAGASLAASPAATSSIPWQTGSPADRMRPAIPPSPWQTRSPADRMRPPPPRVAPNLRRAL